NSIVVCTFEKCKPPPKHCYAVKLPNSCCPKCLSCLYLDKEYENNQVWHDAQRPCLKYSCKVSGSYGLLCYFLLTNGKLDSINVRLLQDGIITSWRNKCIHYCQKAIRISTYCCLLCEKPLLTTDPCIVCESVLGFYYHCYRVGCPVLNCSTEQQIHLPNQCCPQCKSYPKRILKLDSNSRSYNSSCILQNKQIDHNQTVNIDQCTKCHCRNGVIFCQRFSHIVPNSLDGAYWNSENCTVCRCNGGKVRCHKQNCKWKDRCPIGRVIKHKNNSCCNTCEFAEGTCSIFGDPHYITFDRMGYSFHGKCSYILSQSCTKKGNSKRIPKFTIVAQNPNYSQKQRIQYISVFVTTRSRQNYIIHLLPNKRENWERSYGNNMVIAMVIAMDIMEKYFVVKSYKALALENLTVCEGHRRIATPFKRQDRFLDYKIYEDPVNSNIILSLNTLGVKVSWDGGSYVEIVLAKRHQSNVCGLCGNFNGNANDDLLPRHGPVQTSVAKFVKSWQYGSQCHTKLESQRLC
uniref:VWFC domain-containing protein n=1 Tax=Syphacia muris TaxID=451379 RepID=A0A0N5AFX8_9BILA